jgi:glycosyltransferase involved in cell wall biosynthesis
MGGSRKSVVELVDVSWSVASAKTRLPTDPSDLQRARPGGSRYKFVMPTTSLRRVCLITSGHLATNPRIVKEADALSEAGYDVNVIATDFLDWAHTADVEFSDRSWYVGWKVPFGRRASLQQYFKQTIRRKTCRAILKKTVSNRFLIERAIHPVVPELIEAALSIPAELYVAHYTAALPAAATAANRFGSFYAFDAEDFHLGDLADDARPAFDRMLIRAIEEDLLPKCAYLTAASPGIADAYAQTYGLRKPTVLLNVFPRANAPAGPTAAGKVSPGPSVYWFSQTIGRNRGLEVAVEAIAVSAARPYLYLRGSLATGYRDVLETLARRHGVLDRVRLLDPESPSSMERLASEYDVGLVGEIGETQNHRIALSNKLFTYLLAGIPVVASSIPAHTTLSGVDGAVRLYETLDPHAMARALDSLLLAPSRLAEARQRAWRLGQERFNWDVEKQILLSVIEGLDVEKSRSRELV